MYINPFVAGVLATIFVELLLFIGFSITTVIKNKEEK